MEVYHSVFNLPTDNDYYYYGNGGGSGSEYSNNNNSTTTTTTNNNNSSISSTNQQQQQQPSLNISLLRSTADHALSFPEFLDFLILLALRCPYFRMSQNSPRVKLCNFLHLLNLSPGKEILSKRNRSSEMVIFKPIVEVLANSKVEYDKTQRTIVQRKRKKKIEELRDMIVNP